MKLDKTMRDFVLETVHTPNINEAICWEQTEEILQKIYNRAKFIKQPLELWMFFACDEDGNILKYSDENYQKAKERVLFEGFEFTKSQSYSVKNEINNSVHFYTKDRLYFTIKKVGGYHSYFELFTIEDLIPLKLTLTQTAIKQLIL